MSDRHDAVEAMLRAQRQDAFAPGFAHRVMRRVREEQAAPGAAFAAALQRQFLRLAPPFAAAVVALAALAAATIEGGRAGWTQPAVLGG